MNWGDCCLGSSEIYYRGYGPAQAHRDTMMAMKGQIDAAAGVPLLHYPRNRAPSRPRKLTLCGPAHARRWGDWGAPDMYPYISPCDMEYD